MTFNGGTVLFNDEVVQDEGKIYQLIIDILEDADTTIDVIRILPIGRKEPLRYTGVFKIILNDTKFSSKFKSVPLYNISAPRVLIIKLFIGYTDASVENEINNQAIIGSRTNLMPICPSFLIAERIKMPNMSPTRLGEVFYTLFKKKSKTEYDKLDPLEKNSVQDILIMEFINCYTYFTFLNKTIPGRKTDTKNPLYKYRIYDIEINLEGHDELCNFFTYYMASLLAIIGFHHSDMHHSNVMICSDKEKRNVLPFVIDFGRSGKITTQELVFKKLIGEGISKLQLDSNDEPTNEDDKYIRPIYLDSQTNEASIADYVLSLITEGDYVDAVLTLSMCTNPNSEAPSNSFLRAFYDSNNKTYEYLYKMNSMRKEKYNDMIKKLIKKRNLLKQELERQLTPGHTSVSSEQTNDATASITRGTKMAIDRINTRAADTPMAADTRETTRAADTPRAATRMKTMAAERINTRATDTMDTPMAAKKTETPMAVEENKEPPLLNQKIKFNIGDRVQVRNKNDFFWRYGTVTQINPQRAKLDKSGVAESYITRLDFWDIVLPISNTVGARIARGVSKGLDRTADIVFYPLDYASNALKRRTQRKADQVTVRIGGKRKQTRKRRKSLTITNMKIGKRTPPKKTLRNKIKQKLKLKNKY